MNEDKTRVHSNQGGNTGLCKTRLKNMGPNKSWYVAALVRLGSLNCRENIDRNVIERTFRHTGKMGPGHSLGGSRLVVY
jgi:hypothetical protein